jgi:hypothetical protein
MLNIYLFLKSYKNDIFQVSAILNMFNKKKKWAFDLKITFFYNYQGYLLYVFYDPCIVELEFKK